MAKGIDVSNNNGTVNWDGVEFCFIKATESTTFVDSTFDKWRGEATDRGIPWGAYHFAHPDQHTAQQEADFFLIHARPGAIPPALDFESRTNVNPIAVMGVDKAAAWIDEWCQRVEAAWNQVPFLYTYRAYASLLLPHVLAWPLWLASASGAPDSYHTFAGHDVAIEQWGQVGGVDRNESYITLITTGDNDMTDDQAKQLDAVYKVVTATDAFSDPNGTPSDMHWAAGYAASTSARILELLSKGSSSGSGPGVTEDQIRAIIREELNKSHLTSN